MMFFDQCLVCLAVPPSWIHCCCAGSFLGNHLVAKGCATKSLFRRARVRRFLSNLVCHFPAIAYGIENGDSCKTEHRAGGPQVRRTFRSTATMRISRMTRSGGCRNRHATRRWRIQSGFDREAHRTAGLEHRNRHQTFRQGRDHLEPPRSGTGNEKDARSGAAGLLRYAE